MLESIFGTERTVRFLREKRPAEGVDREVYDKLLAFADRSFGSILAEQFFAMATIIVIYCLIGWKLDIPPQYVILAALSADLLGWPYSLSRIRQVAQEKEEEEPEQYCESKVQKFLDDIMNGE